MFVEAKTDMSKPIGLIVGAVVGGIILVVVILAWFFRSRCRFSNKNSESGSSNPSAVEWNKGCESGSTTGQLPPFGSQGVRQFTMEEMEQATNKFSNNNLIGYGNFGSVYKGLLHDTVVAVKLRSGAPREQLVVEVTYLSQVRHRHLVTLLGYCQEGGSQMLVFEYIPNGSLCNHLYDTGLASSSRIEFKQRLSIALGAAKGLSHLHSLNPPLIHKNFKTANVLVDENFIVKVADVGISRLVERMEEAGPSHTSGVNAFQDPEVVVSGNFTETSDVYSFGVFLLELITGQEASQIDSLGSYESLIEKVASRLSSNNFVDHRLMGRFTAEGMKDFIRLALRCISFPRQGRPTMEFVVLELERIHEKEMALTMVMGENTTIIKGSELFS